MFSAVQEQKNLVLENAYKLIDLLNLQNSFTWFEVGNISSSSLLFGISSKIIV